MSTLAITLSEDRLVKLREIADRFNIKPEDLTRVSIVETVAESRVADPLRSTNMDPMTPESILRILLGFVVLLAGRNIFWLFIALVGFLVGIELAGIWLAGQPMWLIIIVAIGAGFIGAALSMLFQRVAFALAGFYATAYLAIMFTAKLGFDTVPVSVIFAAGLVGALLAALLMDWAIIVLSSLAGAAAIMSGVSVDRAVEVAIFVVLATIGVLVQRAVLARRGLP